MVSGNLTTIELFKNVPLFDFQNTILFENLKKRDDHFPRHYVKKDFKLRFNFIRDRMNVQVPIPYFQCKEYNYGRFKSSEENMWYYFFVAEYHYLNDEITELTLLEDVLLTHVQGDVLKNINNVYVMRTHLTLKDYNQRLLELQTNNDILPVTTKQYIKLENHTFQKLSVLFQSTVDLSRDFGTVDQPIINSSQGVTYDKNTSPVDLYVMTQNNFNSFMRQLSTYAWVSQNITKVLLIPSELIDETTLEDVTINKDKIKNMNVKKFKNNSISKSFDISKLDKSIEELYKIYDLTNDDRHLLRQEYFGLELFNYTGGHLQIDPSFLDPRIGLSLVPLTIVGYDNRLVIYPKNYKSHANEIKVGGVDKGTFLNDSLIFNEFDTVPVLTNNAMLSRAKSANRRELIDSQTVSNRAENVLTGNDMESRIYDAINLSASLSPSALLGRYTNEYEHYREQMAGFQDDMLQSPSISEQNTLNSFNIKHNIYGVTVKYSAPTYRQLNNIKKYHKTVGYQLNEYMKLPDIRSMTLCNYIQFKGSWLIHGVDVSAMERLRLQFENGVKFWHDDGTANPMNKDILFNVVRT